MGRSGGCQDMSYLPLSPWPVSRLKLMSWQNRLPPGPIPRAPGNQTLSVKPRPGSAANAAPSDLPRDPSVGPCCPFFALWACACYSLSQN